MHENAHFSASFRGKTVTNLKVHFERAVLLNKNTEQYKCHIAIKEDKYENYAKSCNMLSIQSNENKQ